MAFIYFFLAVIFLILGHSVRVKRWNNIFPGNDNTLRGIQFASLSLGYVVNFFVPLRLGEVVRAIVFSYLGKKNFSLSFASVIFERVLDVLIIIIIVLFLEGGIKHEFNSYFNRLIIPLCLAIFFLLFCSTVGDSKKIKKIVNSLTGIFNDEISYSLRHFFWCFNEVYLSFRKSFSSFLLNSLFMWAAYIASYFFIAKCTNVSVSILINSLFDSPFESTFNILQSKSVPDVFFILSLYFLSPVLFIFSYLYIKNKYSFHPQKLLSWFSCSDESIPNKKDLFATEEQYKMFLIRSFRNDVDLLSEFYKKGMTRDTILHRIFHGGSDALTTLISYNNNLYVRKFASVLGSSKLKAQRKWLNDYSSDLMLAPVTNENLLEQAYIYDMPYSHTSIDFYEFIHSSSLETSWSYLEGVLNAIKAFHEKNSAGMAENKIVEIYVNEKMVANFDKIKLLTPMFFDQEKITINGQNIDLKRIDSWVHNEARINDFTIRDISVIHGDLTIENIVIDKNHSNGWFIIDPNIGNFFESPLLDYAKLMQSLHLGYESLNRSITCQCDDDSVTVSIFRSSQYADIYDAYKKWINDSFGETFLKEVFLHEIIHFARLVPYKFRKDKTVGNAFTACMLLLINEYLDEIEYGN